MKPDSELIKEIFSRAAEKKSPWERESYLVEACQGQPELRQEVDGLLQAHERAGGFLDETITLPGSAFVAERAGTMIGRYKLLEPIGEGGYGSVWMAEQEEPVRRRVALKVIKPGMDTKQVLARFEAERQALAMMDHPSIARVFDGGATETGRPYFVMELVRGTRITDYCDANKLSMRERLALFIQVCQAVQHAHQKGIIHRDLKPSNILVTEVNGAPVPKVIDFGVAKATQARLTDLTLFTGLHQMIGTPAYMSPEQAGLGALDIDTRSDIYALGVLLYELLTGQTPLTKKDFEKAGMDEFFRLIREKDPPKPSTRLSALTNAELTAIAAQRQAEPVKLNRLFRGDLDWIVMKALDKDRRRRYETAGTLAHDIERHLKNEPVAAAPPSWSYLVGKTLRKHRHAVMVTAALAFLLVAGTVVSLWQADRARKAEANEKAARRVAELSSVQAEKNARKASESEQTARRLLYTADMGLASHAWEDGNLSRMIRLLDAHHLEPGQADLRGFEFFFLQNLAKGEQQYALQGHTNAVLGVAISPDGKWLASRSLTDTRLWDLQQRKVVAVWPSSGPRDSSAGRYGVSFSFDSQYLAVETKAGLQLCEVSTLQSRMLATGRAFRAVFSPVTNLIAFDSNIPGEGREQPRIRIWDYLIDKELVVSEPGAGEIWQWSPDGSRLLSDQGNWNVRWWDATTLACVETKRAVKQFVFGATVSPDGHKLATADWSGEIRVWPMAGGDVLATMPGGDTAASALAFSQDGKMLATSSRNEAILIWNATNGQQVGELRGHRGKIRALAFSPDGNLLASAGEDGDVMLWNPPFQSRQSVVSNELTYVAGNPPKFSPDAKLLAVAYNWQNTLILDASTLRQKASRPGPVASFAPDGRQVAALVPTSKGQVLKIWDLEAKTNRAAVYLTSAKGGLLAPELSPDGDLLAFTALDEHERSSSFLCDAATGESILFVTNSEIGNGFLRDGRVWVCIAGSQIRFWDVRTRQHTHSLDCHEAITRLAVSRDGKLLAASRADYTILLWDADSGTELGTLSGHQAAVWALAFSPDGRTLASGSVDRTVKLWNLATLREAVSVPEQQAVCWLAFSPDNQILVSGGFGSYHVLRAPRVDATAWSAPGLADLPTNSIWRVPDGYGDNVIKFREDALAYQRTLSGPESLDTLEAMDILASSYHTTGHRDKALKVREEVLALRRKISGPENNDTLQAMANMANSYDEAGRQEEALKLREELLALRRKVNSTENEGTFTAMTDLTTSYQEAGRQDEAIKLQEEVLALLRKMAGPEHPVTIWALENLAYSYDQTGRDTEPISLQEKAVDPKNTDASLALATWQTWFGRDAAYEVTRRRFVQESEGTDQSTTAERAAKAYCLRSSTNAALLTNILHLAQRAVDLGKNDQFSPWNQLTLGLAEYRNSQYAAAEHTLTVAEQTAGEFRDIPGTARLFRAMSLFRQDKPDEARKLFRQAEAQMPPLPAHEREPDVEDNLAGKDMLICWLAYKEAKSLLNEPTAAKP
jgi:WD40 repeat protein/serine/threonine protein kinase